MNALVLYAKNCFRLITRSKRTKKTKLDFQVGIYRLLVPTCICKANTFVNHN